VRLGDGHEAAHIRAIIDHWLLGLYDGVDTLLADLRARGITTACLSNTNEQHWHLMMSRPAFAALRQLDHLHASHLARARKPDAGIYEHLEQHTRATGPAVVFFDDLQANIEAAATRGWRATLIEPNIDPIEQIRRRLGNLGVWG